MRYLKHLKRAFLGWLVLTPACYFLLLPYLVHKMEDRIRTENYTACVEQMKPPDAPAPDAAAAAAGDKYCHCITDGLTLHTYDLITIMRKQPLVRLTEYVQMQVDVCTDQTTAETQAKKPKEPEVIYFNNNEGKK